MPQVVDPYIFQTGPLANTFPGRLKIAKVPSRTSTENDPRPSRLAW